MPMQLRKAVLLCCLTIFSIAGFAAEKATNKPVYGRYEKIKMMDRSFCTVNTCCMRAFQ